MNFAALELNFNSLWREERVSVWGLSVVRSHQETHGGMVGTGAWVVTGLSSWWHLSDVNIWANVCIMSSVICWPHRVRWGEEQKERRDLNHIPPISNGYAACPVFCWYLECYNNLSIQKYFHISQYTSTNNPIKSMFPIHRKLGIPRVWWRI